MKIGNKGELRVREREIERDGEREREREKKRDGEREREGRFYCFSALL